MMFDGVQNKQTGLYTCVCKICLEHHQCQGPHAKRLLAEWRKGHREVHLQSTPPVV